MYSESLFGDAESERNAREQSTWDWSRKATNNVSIVIPRASPVILPPYTPPDVIGDQEEEEDVENMAIPRTQESDLQSEERAYSDVASLVKRIEAQEDTVSV